METCVDDALSRDLCASVPRKVVLVRAHDWFDGRSDVSVEQQVEPHLEFLRPLLHRSLTTLMLLGGSLIPVASTLVLAESNLSVFRSVLQDGEGLGGYKAANGSSVNIESTCQALLKLAYRCTCQAHQVMIGVGRRHV